MTIVRQAKVFVCMKVAGFLEETDAGTYRFTYDKQYLRKSPPPLPVSLTLPLRPEPYESKILFPFFDGLIPEGWLLDLTVRNWKLDRRDRMGLLLEACGDCVGAVHVEKIDNRAVK